MTIKNNTYNRIRDEKNRMRKALRNNMSNGACLDYVDQSELFIKLQTFFYWATGAHNFKTDNSQVFRRYTI